MTAKPPRQSRQSRQPRQPRKAAQARQQPQEGARVGGLVVDAGGRPQTDEGGRPLHREDQ